MCSNGQDLLCFLFPFTDLLKQKAMSGKDVVFG